MNMAKPVLYPETREEELGNANFEHGPGGYNNHNCRGPICRAAHALATATTREERRRYTAQFGLPEHVKHGASAYTNWGCKCDVCKEGHNEECAKYRV